MDSCFVGMTKQTLQPLQGYGELAIICKAFHALLLISNPFGIKTSGNPKGMKHIEIPKIPKG